MDRRALPFSGCLVLFTAGALAPSAQAQQILDARADLRARVIARADGEKRFIPDGRFMLLKVGPDNTNAGYLFMGYEDLPPGTAIPRHRHELDEEILIVLDGRLMFTFANDSAIAGPGDAVFLPPATWVSARTVGSDTASIFFIFPRGAVEQCFRHLAHAEGEAPRPRTKEALEEMKQACQMSF